VSDPANEELIRLMIRKVEMIAFLILCLIKFRFNYFMLGFDYLSRLNFKTNSSFINY
jgi:hypothetical protein